MATLITGNKTEIWRAGSKVPWKVVDVDPPAPKGTVIPASTLDTEGGEDKIIAPLYDAGQVTLTVEHDGSYPTLFVWESTVIKYTTGKTTTFDGAILEYKPNKVDNGTGMTATMTIEARGALTHAG